MNNSEINFGQRTSLLVVFLVLFGLHVVSSTAFLHRIPGLLGDEGSEGENVWQIVDHKQLTVLGERSYIGPIIDYVRIPFTVLFGYSALSLRVLTLLFSLGTFGLAWLVFRRWFGPGPSLYILSFMFFSPAYILQQRLGWAITLIPFFALLMLWLFQRSWSIRPLLLGVAGGLGLSNHFIFLPTLVSIVGLSLLGAIIIYHQQGKQRWLRHAITTAVIFLIGFWAAFGTQFAVMMLQPEDQGSPPDVIAAVLDRLHTLPIIFPDLLSGSTYSALYTGTPYPDILSMGIVLVLIGGMIAALVRRPHRPHTLVWLLTIIINIALLVLIIDRHAVRYYVPAIVGLWGLAGLGYYKLVSLLFSRSVFVWPVLAAACLLVLTSWYTLFPYLRSEGSTAAIQLHAGRSESAAAYVDVRPLVTCLETAGPVFSDNVHIYNRLLYLSRGNPLLAVADEAYQAQWLVDYRDSDAVTLESCPLLRHFTVVPNPASDIKSRDD